MPQRAPPTSVTMAPNHSKLVPEKKALKKVVPNKLKKPVFMKHPIQKLQDGDVVFSDEFVNAMAEGKKHDFKGGFDSILVECLAEKENKKPDPEGKRPQGRPKDDRKYSPFQKCEDAECYSDGERVIENSFIADHSYCEEEEKEPFLTQLSEATPPKKKGGLVQAEGFNLNDYMAEEEPEDPNACPHCRRNPCIIDDPASIEEGDEIVNDLLMDRMGGMEVGNNKFRFALYQMYARHLRFCDRTMLPKCVYYFINKHFKEEGEPSTGFREKTNNI